MNDNSHTPPPLRDTPWSERAHAQYTSQYAPEVLLQTGSAIDYLKQVYALLAGSLVVAVAAGFVGISSPFAHEHPYLLMFLQLGALLLAMWKKNTATLFLFTSLSGFSLGPLIGLYIGKGMASVVGQALAMTGIAFTGLTVFAFTTKRDLSGMANMLFVGLLVLVGGGLVNLFMQSAAFSFGLAGMGALVFSGYLLYETQQLKQAPWALAPAEAALSLYLDIVNLFLSLLRLLGLLGSSDD